MSESAFSASLETFNYLRETGVSAESADCFRATSLKYCNEQFWYKVFCLLGARKTFEAQISHSFCFIATEKGVIGHLLDDSQLLESHSHT